MKSLQSLLALASIALLSACSQHTPPQPAHPEPPFRLTATIRELMDAEVDPSADAIWESVGFIATASGTEERRPRTDEEWQTVRRHALTLIEATNLLMMEGRHAAPADVPPPGEGELAPAEMDRRIAATRPSFIGFAQGLQATGLKALAAIDAKDPQALIDAGGAIDEACEACHVTYWYPNQKYPGT
jgi:hypothetical protein